MLNCNIDQRGRKLRLFLGAFIESIGLLLAALWFFAVTPPWAIWPAAAVWLAGVFVLFEAAMGWCAVRAMGIKTPV